MCRYSSMYKIYFFLRCFFISVCRKWYNSIRLFTRNRSMIDYAAVFHWIMHIYLGHQCYHVEWIFNYYYNFVVAIAFIYAKRCSSKLDYYYFCRMKLKYRNELCRTLSYSNAGRWSRPWCMDNTELEFLFFVSLSFGYQTNIITTAMEEFTLLQDVSCLTLSPGRCCDPVPGRILK